MGVRDLKTDGQATAWTNVRRTTDKITKGNGGGKRMKTLKYLLFIAVFSLGGWGAAWAQGYVLTAGGAVGGGGTSTGGTYNVVGAIVNGASGVSSGGTFVASGGPIHAVAAGVSVLYSGKAVDTVPIAPRLLKVGFVGGTGAATGKFYYRYGGQLAYNSINMAAGIGDTLLVTVSPGMLNPRGLEYYFEITRGVVSGYAGSSSYPLLFVPQFQPGTPAGPPVYLPDQSYRMVSMPVNITGPNKVADIFADDLGAYDPKQWRLFRYDVGTDANVEFPNAADVTPSRAYWLIVRGNDKSYSSIGYARRPNRTENGVKYFEIPLDSGWNQMANPLPFAVDWATIEFEYNATLVGHADTVIDDAAYYFNGSGYATVNSIPAWSGVFVNVLKSGVNALVEYHETGAVPARPYIEQTPPLASASHWNLRLTLTAGDFVDDGNLLGVRADAAEGVDRYDLSEPPPAPAGVRLAFKLPGADVPLRRCDFRPAFNDGATWDLVIAQAVDRKLAVSGLDQVPGDLDVKLILASGNVIDLRESGEVTLPNDVESARLVVGTPGFASGETESVLPKEYALDQNFPNPFNPNTRIRFALPAETQLRLTVFNVLGQKVRQLADGIYPAGTHDIVWDGKNDQGTRVGSGMYFYRFESDVFNQTRKMLLIK